MCPAWHTGSNAPCTTFTGGAEFFRYQLVGFAVIGTPLGMADDDILAGKIGQHGAGDLAGVGPGFVHREILTAPGNR